MVTEKKIIYRAKMEALQYILDYECKCTLPAEILSHITKLINEYKLLLNDL